jgi:hypothetical protein
LALPALLPEADLAMLRAACCTSALRTLAPRARPQPPKLSFWARARAGARCAPARRRSSSLCAASGKSARSVGPRPSCARVQQSSTWPGSSAIRRHVRRVRRVRRAWLGAAVITIHELTQRSTVGGLNAPAHGGQLEPTRQTSRRTLSSSAARARHRGDRGVRADADKRRRPSPTAAWRRPVGSRRRPAPRPATSRLATAARGFVRGSRLRARLALLSSSARPP